MRPDANAVLADITAISDGRSTARRLREPQRTLELHELVDGGTVFLVVFSRRATRRRRRPHNRRRHTLVPIPAREGGWWIEERYKGTAFRMLKYMSYDFDRPVPSFSRATASAPCAKEAVRSRGQAPARFYELELAGYTYIDTGLTVRREGACADGSGPITSARR